ncbi:MAG: ribosome small subunit-dependent GTPase A [Bryobacterales bacterium]|nr:ribosome small subunit-dependent GTPase A [Bryobacterales bacterium]
MHLEDLGWSPFFSDSFAEYSRRGLTPARVYRVERGRWDLWTPAGATHASLSGGAAEPPACGDWVAFDGLRIHAILPRKSQLCRKTSGKAVREQVLAANLDVCFIVAGLDGDFNQRRIERYLAVVRQGGARPVIVLNKADLAVPPTCPLGAPVAVVSAWTGLGMDALGAHARRGETAVFIGSSGAGKSTLINRLLGDDRQATQPVREHDSRGRHTTSRRECFMLPSGWILMDLPGIREIGLWESDARSAFPDVAGLAETCRFANCTHTHEPGCSVRDALDPARLESFRKLEREQAYLRTLADVPAARERSPESKRAHKAPRSRLTPKR